MAWIKMDDRLDENAKQLAMTDAAFRVWVCSWSFCARQQPCTDHMSRQQAHALVRKLGKHPRVVEELVGLNAWERDDDGYTVHDLAEHLEKSSAERVRKHREMKRARNVTETNGGVTETLPSRARVPEPEPVPEPNPPSETPSLTAPEGAIVPVTSPQIAVVRTVQSAERSAYERFLAALNEATGRNFRGDVESRKLFIKRLADGRSVEDLCYAARGVARSSHHMGLNDSGIPYNAPANVLRSKVLDQLIGLGKGEIGFTRKATRDEQAQIDAQEWARRMEGRG